MTQNNTDNRLKTMITAALFAALACGIICRRIKKLPEPAMQQSFWEVFPISSW